MNESDMIVCEHPQLKRWQWNGWWQCGQCNGSFHGDKRSEPLSGDMYGRKPVYRPCARLQGK